jgi:hypothetical protein
VAQATAGASGLAVEFPDGNFAKWPGRAGGTQRPPTPKAIGDHSIRAKPETQIPTQ